MSEQMEFDFKECKLTRMMEMQEILNTNVIIKSQLTDFPLKHYREGSDQEKREWADNFMSALQAETVETREALTRRVKFWKNKTKDMDGIRDEISDCWHFIMSASLAVGMTADDVYEEYARKNKANFSRQDWDINKEVDNGKSTAEGRV